MKLTAMLAQAKNASRPVREYVPEIDPDDHVPGLDPVPDIPMKRADSWPADGTGAVTHPPEVVPPADLGIFTDQDGQGWLAAKSAGSNKLTLILGPLPKFHNLTPF